MGLLIRGLKSQHVHFPRSNPHCMVGGGKSGNSQGTIPGLCLPIGAPTIHGGRGSVRHLFSAPAQACFLPPNCPCHFLARQSPPLPLKNAIPGKTRRFRSVCVQLFSYVRIVTNQRSHGDDDPLQVCTTCEVFQAFIIKTEVCSQFYLENRTHISLRTRILTNSEFYMWPTTYYQAGTFLITSDTPVAAAQA